MQLIPICVHAGEPGGHTIDVYEVVQTLKRAGLSTPLLLRFPEIVTDRWVVHASTACAWVKRWMRHLCTQAISPSSQLLVLLLCMCAWSCMA